MFKTVSLPAATWQSVIRRLTVEVGADDTSRKWAAAIQEQLSGAVTVKVSKSKGSVELKAGKGGDLRGLIDHMG